MRNVIFFLLSCLVFGGSARGDFFLNAQHSGYAGEGAAGLGYAGPSFGADALYGWTSSSLAGHEVRSWTVKGLWYLFAIGYPSEFNVRPYLGLGAFYSS